MAKKPKQDTANLEHELIMLSIDLPQLSGEREGPGHVDGQLTRDQAQALRRLQRALDHRGDRLASGRRVQSAIDAVRWLLEQIAFRSP